MSKKLKWLISILLIIITYCSIVTIAFNRKIDVPISVCTKKELYITYDFLLDEYDPSVVYNKSKEEYRDLISDELNLNCFWCIETNLNDTYNGYMFLFPRLILVDAKLTPIEYCMTFTHEVMHFKRFSNKERHICFETFKWLYEHDNPELHNAGVLYGLYQVQGCYNGEYDIRDCIVNYLEEEIWT